MFQILVVEDDRELNKTVCSYLYQNGYQATGCLDAKAGKGPNKIGHISAATTIQAGGFDGTASGRGLDRRPKVLETGVKRGKRATDSKRPLNTVNDGVKPGGSRMRPRQVQ